MGQTWFSIITKDGEINIPKELKDKLDIVNGDIFYFEVVGHNTLNILPFDPSIPASINTVLIKADENRNIILPQNYLKLFNNKESTECMLILNEDFSLKITIKN